ncbi:MAG: encapsulin [Nannocystales bacterium]
MNDPISAEQHTHISAAVIDEAQKTGTLPPEVLPIREVARATTSVPEERVVANRLVEGPTVTLTEVSVPVSLSVSQVAEADLASAVARFRRAAATLQATCDQLVLRAGAAPAAAAVRHPIAAARTFVGVATASRAINALTPGAGAPPYPADEVVRAVEEAIFDLDAAQHFGPYHVLLGRDMWRFANQRPPGAATLARDSLSARLEAEGGTLSRARGLQPDQGLVVARSGDPFDLVVAVPPTVQYLRHEVDGGEERISYRVWCRFGLRVKEDASVRLLTLPPPVAAAAGAGGGLAGPAEPE